MSGRLVLTSKKGYCPWNPKNLARIEHDEQEHAKTVAHERQQLLTYQREQQYARLRQHQEEPQQRANPATTAPLPPARFQLFAREEAAAAVAAVTTTRPTTSSWAAQKAPPPKIRQRQHRYDYHDAVQHTNSNKTPTPTTTNQKDQRMKVELDPMKNFYYHDE